MKLKVVSFSLEIYTSQKLKKKRYIKIKKLLNMNYYLEQQMMDLVLQTFIENVMEKLIP